MIVCLGLPGATGNAYAIPELTPHRHELVGFEDAAHGGRGVNHHHWDPLFPLYPGNRRPNDEGAAEPNSSLASAGKSFINQAFNAYSAWDQRGNQALYRNGAAVQNFGHGFIAQDVPYRLEAGANGVPAPARADIATAFQVWEADARAMFEDYAGGAFGGATGRVFGMSFAEGAAEDLNFDGLLNPGEDVNNNGALDGLVITWVEGGIPETYAQWTPGLQRLEFDGTRDWYFGGEGVVPVSEDLNGDGALAAAEDRNANGIIDPVPWIDFFTIAVHEVGHVIGLNHINSDEDRDGDGWLDVDEDLDGDGNLDMAEDLNGNGMLDPDEDVDGDGRLDSVGEDVDGDGRLDDAEMDRDGDGFADDTVGYLMDAFVGEEALGGSAGLRRPDPGSVFGALALYTQVPEPSSVWLAGLAMALAAVGRRPARTLTMRIGR